MKMFMMLVLSLLLLMAPVTYGEDFDVATGGIAIEVREVNTGQLFFPDIADLRGNTSDITTDPENWCFNATPQPLFNYGDRISFNTIWTDNAQSDGTNTYDITVAVRLPNGNLLPLCQGPVNFTGLPPGTFNFCVGCFVDTPPNGPSPLDLEWGARVIEDNGDTAQGKIEDLRLQ